MYTEVVSSSKGFITLRAAKRRTFCMGANVNTQILLSREALGALRAREGLALYMALLVTEQKVKAREDFTTF